MNGYGAKVNLTFVQPSPFHPTTTYIIGRNLGGRAGNFHVHVLPKVPKLRVSGVNVLSMAEARMLCSCSYKLC